MPFVCRGAISSGALLLVLAILAGAPACTPGGQRSLVVTATAYNSVPSQTSGDPRRTAWGYVLRPGSKAIAVSRDLIALGLVDGVEVRIEDLPGKYVVRDKMAARWQRRIDIYMGKDVAAARRWGKRRVRIHWSPD